MNSSTDHRMRSRGVAGKNLTIMALLMLAGAGWPDPIRAQLMEVGDSALERSPGLISMQISSGRGLSVATFMLMTEGRFGSLVTYEDPVLEYRADLEPFAANDGREALGLRPMSFAFSYPVSLQSGAPEDTQSFLSTMIGAYHEAGGGARFEVRYTADDIYHIVPTAIRDKDGRWAAYHAVLDSRISIPPQSLDGRAMLDVIVEAISDAAGKPVHVARAHAAFAEHQGLLAANNEAARDVLTRTLEAIADSAFTETRLAWALDYGPEVGYYVLNLRPVRERTPSERTQSTQPEVLSSPASPDATRYERP